MKDETRVNIGRTMSEPQGLLKQPDRSADFLCSVELLRLISPFEIKPEQT